MVKTLAVQLPSMRLPWGKSDDGKNRLEELEQKLEDIREERDSLRERFEAESRRRSELARQKQQAEEKLNRLEDRLDNFGEEDDEEEEIEVDRVRLGFEETLRMLRKLDSVKSPEKDLLTVYSAEEVEKVEDFRGLKNAVTPGQLERLRAAEGFAAFLDPDLESVLLETRPVFGKGWDIGRMFDVSGMLEFIEEEKHWVLVSAGETSIFREQAGEYEEVETVKSRVNRQHSKGGFSQGRFDRKRDEQVEQHLEQVEETLQDRESVYLLGDRRLCEDLPGEHLGGFDPNLSPPEVFYSFQILRQGI